MTTQPLSCQVEADRHATHAPAEGRSHNADAILQAAVTRALNAHRAGLPNLFRVELLAGVRSAERLLGKESRCQTPVVIDSGRWAA